MEKLYRQIIGFLFGALLTGSLAGFVHYPVIAAPSGSVLSTGAWYRISVSETGIHRITYSDLVSMGIDPAGIDPRHIRIYGNGAGMLDEIAGAPRPADLLENSIFVSGENDGVFDTDDFILFYGEDPTVIKYNYFYLQYEHEKNFYSDETCYFLTASLGPGKRVEGAVSIPASPTHEVYHSEELVYHEKDEVNLIKSGKIWVGEVFSSQLRQDFIFDLKHADLSYPVVFKAYLVGKSTTNTEINIYANGEFLEELDVPNTVLGSQIYARPVISNFETFDSQSREVTIGVEFIKPGINDIAWLNYIELNYMRNLVFDGGQLSIRNIRAAGPGNIARYHLQTGNPFPAVWDVTDIGDVRTMDLQPESNGAAFKVTADTLREFIVFDGTAYLSPEFIEVVANQDLRSLQPVDLLVVTHPDFMEQAQRLADHHRIFDGMSVHVVTPQLIYNEFSSGVQDISAIRDFVRLLYERNSPQQSLRYLLLFGDASYDYLGRLEPDHNFVPAYQTRESLKASASFVTDDFFGCINDDEGSNASGDVDVGIGRIPVHTVDQAREMVDKIIGYATGTGSFHGNWRNSITFVGDDEDNNIHLTQAEGLFGITDSLGPVYNVNKIYLDAYEQMQTPSGTRYPDAFEAIRRSVDQGSLIVNYTGHGGETGWAGERVLDIPAIQAFRNLQNMPVFVTATCEFSRYDDPSLVSAGELVFLNPDGGGIGLFTTTRLAYSTSNYALNKRFYDAAFKVDSITGEYPRLGDLIRLAKTPTSQNQKNFVLLGDPALMLAYPKMKVRTLDVTNMNSGRPADTLQALSTVTVTGQVEDWQGNRIESFSGYLYPTVFDKPGLYKTRGNDPSSKVVGFNIQDKVLYEGRVSVENGLFSFTFVVPRDITYNIGPGKISYYAVDTNTFTDAHGFSHVLVGGSDPLADPDLTGPEIKIYLNSTSFQSGDLTTPDPMLMVELFDESGINTVGNGIGHDIVAIIDEDYQMPVVLNDDFNPVTDSFQSGQILRQIGPFTDGIHTLTVRAWDVFNNSSEATVSFEVNTGARLILSDVRANPNPMRDGTTFTFRHNKPGSKFDVTVRVFGITGLPVAEFGYSFASSSQESIPFYWDPLSRNGIELIPGLYVYHLTVTAEDGSSSQASQKLMQIRY